MADENEQQQPPAPSLRPGWKQRGEHNARPLYWHPTLAVGVVWECGYYRIWLDTTPTCNDPEPAMASAERLAAASKPAEPARPHKTCAEHQDRLASEIERLTAERDDARAKLAECERRLTTGLDGYRREIEMHLEALGDMHADRWHASYNAALTGLLAKGYATPDAQAAHDEAAGFATRAHGPLLAPSPQPSPAGDERVRELVDAVRFAFPVAGRILPNTVSLHSNDWRRITRALAALEHHALVAANCERSTAVAS